MLSRFAFCNSAAAGVLLRGIQRPLAVTASNFHTNPHDTEETQRLIDRWDECNKKYYGPYRDTINFPHPTIPETHEGVRLGFIPRSWFDAVYDKTGVSGPYFTLGGFVTYILSKEILVMDHNFFDIFAFYGALILIAKKWGPAMAKYLDERADKLDQKNFHQYMDKTRSAFSSAIGKIDTSIDQEGRHKYIYDIQKENLDLQLEARYRERVSQVYGAVKRRLDYQVELVNARKRFEQQHMVNWIVDNVVKGISPKQEKEAISSCIANLKAIAKAQPSV